MRKNLFAGVTVLVFAVTVGLNIKMNSNQKKSLNLDIVGVEALANDESDYVIGAPFTNWKTYRIKCTFVDIIHIIPGIVEHSRSYEAEKDTCGKGSGWCWGATGC